MSDSFTATYIKPHQCHLHQSILLTQGPNCEISWKNFENWRFWKMSFFWVGHGWVEILMFSLVSRKFLAMRNIVLYSVHAHLTEFSLFYTYRFAALIFLLFVFFVKWFVPNLPFGDIRWIPLRVFYMCHIQCDPKWGGHPTFKPKISEPGL